MLLRSIKFLQKTPKKSFPLISFPVRNIQERFFSQSTTEPSYLIDWEGNEANLEDFQPAYLTDSKRMEIYYKHKNDPKEWSVYNISKRYGLSLSRTKAVLFLMKERENLMEKLGVKDLSDKWTNVYDDYLEDPETNTKEILAQKHSIPIEEVELILNNVGEHYWRKENLHAANEYNDECLDLLDAADIPTEFKETGHVPGSYTFDFPYSPQLFGDDSFEEIKKDLRDRIIRETRAFSVKEPLVKTYESKVQNWRNSFSKIPGLREDPVDKPHPVPENTELSRWKFAFRELRERKKEEPPHPTVIVSRNGSTRLANPLEELNRSWSKRPRGIHSIYGAERLKAYEDPDKDEAQAKAISHADRLRREKLLRENGLLKRKK